VNYYYIVIYIVYIITQTQTKGERNMSQYDEELKDLKKQFPNKRALTLVELSEVMNISIGTIRRGIKIGKGIPEFKKVGSGFERQTVVFPIISVAKFLATPEKVF